MTLPAGQPAHDRPAQLHHYHDWQQLDPATGDAIRAFWEREQANVSGDEATRHLDQVVAHVVDEHGELVAVATVAQKVLPRLGQPMYYYRCFVGQAWRSSKLARPLLRHTQKVLEKYARTNARGSSPGQAARVIESARFDEFVGNESGQPDGCPRSQRGVSLGDETDIPETNAAAR